MSRKRFHPRIAATALIAALAAASPVDAEPSAENPEFVKLDSNRDGFISRDEARRIRDFSKAFAEADSNRDGRLDPDEFVKAQSIHERMRAGQFIEDSVITAKVKAALLKDLRLKGLNVSIETHKGTVLLSGFVDNEEQAKRAAEIAAGVEGVTAVRSSLLVKS